MKIAVKLVRKSSKTALVEWTEDKKRKRVSIPVTEIQDGLVEEETLNYGIPYGVDWAQIIETKATPDIIAEELKKAGLWTVEDILANPQAAVGALQAAYGLDLATLIKYAVSFKKEAS